MSINNGLFSSETDEWATPIDFFNKCNEEFNFTIDVCANVENAKCKRFYSREDDGLSKEWIGTVWLNPPYGSQIKHWIKKAFESGRDGTIVVGLLPARTDTKYFHDYIYGKAEIRFIKGRLKFGGSKNSAPFHSMLVIWGRE